MWQHTHSDDVGIGRPTTARALTPVRTSRRCFSTHTGGRGFRSCYHAVLQEYTPVRKHNRAKTPPFSLVIMIGPGNTKLRRVEFWLAP